MKKALIYGMVTISCTAQAAWAHAQESITHKTCNITLPQAGIDKADAFKKGFTLSTYIFKYQKNGKGSVLSAEMPTANSTLINRNSYLDRGAAALQASLDSLKLDGMTKLKVVSVADGAVQEFTGPFFDGELNFSNTTVLRASFYNTISTYELDRTTDDWIILKAVPVIDSLILATEDFTLRGEAQKILKENLSDREREVFEVIAGQKSLAETSGISEEKMRYYRNVLIHHKIAKETEGTFDQTLATSLPTCVVKE